MPFFCSFNCSLIRGILYVFLLCCPFFLTGQAEVFVNQVSGSPLRAGQTFLLEDDKLTLAGKSGGMDNLQRLENRLLLELSPGKAAKIPSGEYRVLVEIRYWKDEDDLTLAAPYGFIHELVIVVDSLARRSPQVSHYFSEARKLEVEAKRISFNDGAMPPGSPKMKLSGEILVKRTFCPLDVTQTLDSDFFAEQFTADDNLVAVVAAEANGCVDEYDFEYVFYDLDSKVGQILADANLVDNGTVRDYFRNNATRLTSKSTQFRIYNLFREGYILCRYRMVQYDGVTGERAYTRWSDHTSMLHDGTSIYGGAKRVGHQEEYNWQATTSFAEQARQLPAVSYLDGTLRARQSLTLSFLGNNSGVDPSEEYAISQQSLYDAMGRVVATVLPTPIYRSGGSGAPSPLRLTVADLATDLGGNVYGKGQLEQDLADCGVPAMGADAGAGRFYSPGNVRLDDNAYVADAEGYPFAVTRYTPDNTGRISRQGGVGKTLRVGNGHDTRYYYGKPNQWELDRLFGANVGLAAHYEKRMVIDPNGQASVSYLDAKGRTVATALAGSAPDNLSALAAYDEVSGSNQVSVTVDILENVRGDEGLTSSYSLLVPETGTYDICYALAGADYCAEPCEDGDLSLPAPGCATCRYDVLITIRPAGCETTSVSPVTVELTDVAAVGVLENCLGSGPISELSNLLLEPGEYHIEKTVRVNEASVEVAVAAYAAAENSCLVSEGAFIEDYKERVGVPTCTECDCSLPVGQLPDDCEEFCQRISPCAALRFQLEGDLKPGGQYARYGYDPSTGEYGAPGDVPLSIFLAFGGTTTIPYYQTVDYEGAAVSIEGETKTPDELTIDAFIRNWDESWMVDELLAYHPEKCFLDWCDDNLDSSGGSVNLTSYGFDDAARERSSVAEALSFLGASLGSGSSRAVLEELFEALADADPFFALNGSGLKSSFTNRFTAGTANTSDDVPGIVIEYMSGTFGAGWAWTTAPAYQRDIGWRTVRDLYLGRKAVFVADQQRSHCDNTSHTGIHGTYWQCLRQPLCDNEYLDCDPQFPGYCDPPTEYADFSARWAQINRIELLTDTNLDITEMNALESNLRAAARANCDTTCASYRTAWAAQLSACPVFLHNLEAILDEFEAICKTGCADDQYWGTSTMVPFGTTSPGGYASFEEVLEAYLSFAGSCEEGACSSSLINYPPPAGRDAYAGPLTISAEQMPFWLFANEAALTSRLSLACGPCVQTIQSGEEPAGAAKTGATCNIDLGDIARLNNLSLAEVTRTYTAIDAFINNGNAVPALAATDFVIPAEFNPGGKYCTTRQGINALKVQFSNKDRCDTIPLDTAAWEAAQTEFLNARLGWDRSTEDYRYITDTATNCWVCADPPADIAPPTANDPLADCNAELLRQLELEAGYAYAGYRREGLADYAGAYRRYCLGAAEERLELRYAPREYHYTLYYYDQAANLVMTVPPQGVAPLELDPGDAINEANLRAFRAGLVDSREPTGGGSPDPQGLLAEHKMRTHYLYNSFNAVRLRDNPDAEPSRTWYDPVGRPVLSEDGRQTDGELLSYTLYDNLGRTLEVGETSVDPATTPNLRGALIAKGEGGILAMGMQNQYPRSYVTRTYYTDSPFPLLDPNGEALLPRTPTTTRNRVLATTFTEVVSTPGGGGGYDYASHYDYDIAGNVAELIQDFEELEEDQRYKRLEYEYDLLSGNVNFLFYQAGRRDNFSYHYKYDKLNRLTDVYTSEQAYDRTTDLDPATSGTWKREATYNYYDHGPLKRMVLGQNRLQGCDYAYTLQGWIKGVNGSLGDEEVFACLGPSDMGQDGTGTGTATNYRDLYRYSNQYFHEDYIPINFAEVGNPHYSILEANGGQEYELFNGNIFRHFKTTASDRFRTVGLVGLYDQLNRLEWSGNNFYDEGYTSPEPYVNNVREELTYDGNGNINELIRSYQAVDPTGGDYGGTNTLDYHYDPDGESNLLRSVTVTTATTGAANSFQPVSFLAGGQQYDYDASGNLATTLHGGDRESLIWTPYGKVRQVDREESDSPTGYSNFGYGPDQNRWKKTQRDTRSGSEKWTGDFYVRDAQGNVLAVYRKDYEAVATDNLSWQTQYLYGSSRLGAVTLERDLTAGTNEPLNTFGARRYELTNHLGNVPITFSENVVTYTDQANTTYQAPEILSHQDYTAFGLEWHRSPSLAAGGGYRYGFNGKEKDSEGEWGDLTHYDYGFRIYNPAIARFLSVDPLAPDYPWYTPYQFAGNSPIANTDVDGLEPIESITSKEDGTLIIANVKSNWVTVSATRALPGQLHGNDPISRNARTNPHTDVIGNLSSNVPTNGATGYAGEVANSALAPIAAIGGGVMFAGAAGMFSGSVVMPTLPSAASLSSFASTTFKVSSKGATSRFIGDGASQFVFSMARNESFLDNYNFASGLSSAFANPFVGAFVAGSVNVSYNNPLDISLARGVGSSLIGGTLGYTAGRVLGPTIKEIKPLHSWKGSYGDTFKINPIKHIFGAVPPAFTKGPAKFFPDLNEFNRGNVNLKEFDNSDK